MDLTYFIKYNIECINDSLKDLSEYIKEKQKEQQEARNMVDKKFGFNIRQLDIVRKFRREPNKIFTIKEMVESYGVSYATARADLFLLVEKGMIVKKLAGKEFIFMFNK